jgi:hypothetical protein
MGLIRSERRQKNVGRKGGISEKTTGSGVSIIASSVSSVSISANCPACSDEDT